MEPNFSAVKYMAKHTFDIPLIWYDGYFLEVIEKIQTTKEAMD